MLSGPEFFIFLRPFYNVGPLSFMWGTAQFYVGDRLVLCGKPQVLCGKPQFYVGNHNFYVGIPLFYVRNHKIISPKGRNPRRVTMELSDVVIDTSAKPSCLSAFNPLLARSAMTAMAGVASKLYEQMYLDSQGPLWSENYRLVFQTCVHNLITAGHANATNMLAIAKTALVEEGISDEELSATIAKVLRRLRDAQILGTEQIKLRIGSQEFRTYPLIGDLDQERWWIVTTYDKHNGVHNEPKLATKHDMSGDADSESKFSDSALEALQKLNNVKFRLLPGAGFAIEDYNEAKMAEETAKPLGTKSQAERTKELKALQRSLDLNLQAFRRTTKSLQPNDEFCLAWHCDSKFRHYAAGMLGVTNSKLNKAFLQFAEEGPVDMNRIYIAIARESAFEGDDDEAELIGRLMAEEGKFPSVYAKNMFENPAHALVGIDNRTSIIQITAAATGNLEGCRISQLTGTTTVEPGGHSAVAMKASELLGTKIPEKVSKSLTSPIGYGQAGDYAATQNGFEPNVGDAVEDALEFFCNIKSLKRHVRNGMAPGIRDTSDPYIQWETGDGCLVRQTKTMYDVHRAGPMVACTLHSTGKLDEEALARWVLPSIIHSVDGFIAREVVRKCDFPVVFIHDNFFCHSGNVSAMNDAIVTATRTSIELELVRKAWESIGLRWRYKSIDPALVTNKYMVR